MNAQMPAGPYVCGDRVKDTIWGGTHAGTVIADQDADGLVCVRWDGVAFTEDQVPACELVRIPGHGDPYGPFLVADGGPR